MLFGEIIHPRVSEEFGIKMHHKKLLGVFTILCLLLTLIVAVPVFAYVYYAPISVSENGTSSWDMLPVIITIDNEWMADNGFMTATGLDTRIETLGGSEKPHMVVDNITLFATVVPTNSQTNLYYTTFGTSNLTSFKIISGFDGYITTADSASLELSDNGSIEVSGYLNASDYTEANNSPTSHTDPDGQWSNEALSYDGNTSTGSTESVNAATWSKYLQLAPADPMNISKVRYYCTDNYSTQIGVDLYYDGAWTNIYEGAITTDAWAEISYTASLVRQARVRLYNGDAGTQTLWLNEFQFYGVATPILFRKADALDVYLSSDTGNLTASANNTAIKAVATGLTSAETTISVNASSNAPVWADGYVLNFPRGTTTATVNATSSYNGSSPFLVSMHIKPATAWSSANTSDMHFLGQYADGNHEFRIRFKQADGTINAYLYDSGYTFLLGTTKTSWAANVPIWVFLALGQNIDQGASYNGTVFMVDNEIKTDTDNTSLPNGGDLTIGGYRVSDQTGFCGQIFNVVIGTDHITTAEINNLKNGIAPGDETDYYYLDEGSGTTAYSYGSGYNDGTIGASCTWSTSNYTSGKTGRLCDFILGIDDDRWGANMHGTVIPNNAENITWLANNVMPYADNITISVNGTQQLWYEPNTMIIGTNLPDRASVVSNNGTFHWGSNPDGISLALGSILTSTQPSIGEPVQSPTIDMLPDTDTSDWFQETDVSVTGSLRTNPFRPLVTILSDTTELTELQAWRLLAIALVLLVTVGTARAAKGHQFITGIASGASLYACIHLTIFPTWALVFVAMAVFAGLISERSPSL